MVPELFGDDRWAKEVSDRLALVRERIADAGGDPERVQVVAVTKGQSHRAVRAAVTAGLVDFGESYAQELVEKVDAVEGTSEMGAFGPLRWHWIGQLQKNKVKQVAPVVHLWQSIDRLSVASEVARRAPGAAVLVQVNVSDAPRQGGCVPALTPSVVEGCSDLGLEVRGLMAIGVQGPPDAQRAGFRTLRTLADILGLPERSMGMSSDLEAAVAEGTTMVRVGTALFGERVSPRGGSSAVGK